MALKANLVRMLFKSRMGPAVIVGVAALAVIGGYHFQLLRLEDRIEGLVASQAEAVYAAESHRAEVDRIARQLDRYREDVEARIQIIEAEALAFERRSLEAYEEEKAKSRPVDTSVEGMNEWLEQQR